jgi:NAD(P)-dependent dehydrogenase (short-subunit alcohol dehydrogenase family)
VVLITGASTGIGAATAAHFAARGWRVFATARTPARVVAGPTVTPLALDVRAPDSVRAAVAGVLADAGRIDALVNNAGYAVVGGLEETSAEQLHAVLDTNVVGAHRVTAAVLPAMRAAGRGRVVNVSSVVGRVPSPFMGAYAARKHALEGWSESLDHEVRPFGVRVALVEPGFTRTAIAQNQQLADALVPAYAAARDRVLGVVTAGIEGGATPEGVAAVIHEAATARHPRLRYPAGRDAAVLDALRRSCRSACLAGRSGGSSRSTSPGPERPRLPAPGPCPPAAPRDVVGERRHAAGRHDPLHRPSPTRFRAPSCATPSSSPMLPTPGTAPPTPPRRTASSTTGTPTRGRCTRRASW